MFYVHVEMSLESYNKIKDEVIVEDFGFEVERGTIGEIRLYQDEAGDFVDLVEFLDSKGIQYIAFAGQETRKDTSEIRVNHLGIIVQKTVVGSYFDFGEVRKCHRCGGEIAGEFEEGSVDGTFYHPLCYRQAILEGSDSYSLRGI